MLLKFSMFFVIMALTGVGCGNFGGQTPMNAGQCRLSCNKPIIANADPTRYKIENMTSVANFSCPATAAGAASPIPVTVMFRVSKSVKSVNKADAEGGETSISTIPNISFDPIVSGAGTNSSEDGSAPYRYMGILTPDADWCSDSCGVITVDVVPTCPSVGASSDVTIQVRSGALFSDEVKFTVNTLEP